LSATQNTVLYCGALHCK